MNSNKISCQKYGFEQIKYNLCPILELSVKFISQICHENTNAPLDGAYLADFGIDLSWKKTGLESKGRLSTTVPILWLCLSENVSRLDALL